MDAHDFLVALTIVLGTAGLTTVLFQRLKLPVVLGYLLAGLIVGPSLPVPIYADRNVVSMLSELGLILLLYALGLEFSLRRLVVIAPSVGPAALFQSCMLVWLGYLLGRAFGWSSVESLFAGGVVAISSTTIVARAFDEQRLGGKLRQLVIGILVVEDLIGILLIALLTTVGSGETAGAGALFAAGLRLAAVLGAVIVVGLWLVPRSTRWLKRLERPETLLVAAIAFCFGLSLLMHELGYSVALGAFLAGSLMAESGEQHYLEELVRPVRDLFAAVFFVSVGMLIDPHVIATHWFAILAFSVLVVVGKFASVALGAFLSGNGMRVSIQAGLALTQIGEFAFIIAGLGQTLGVTGEFLSALAVAVSVLTTLTTPLFIQHSERIANWVERKLPRALQTYAALYGSWIERLRRPEARRGARALLLRRANWLVLDALLFAAIVILGALRGPAASAWLVAHAGLGERAADWLVLGATAALVVPFGLGLLRLSRRLGQDLAEAALPRPPRGADFGAAPRRAFALALQVALLLAVALPLLAFVQPFLPSLPTLGLALLLVLGFGWALQRGASNLHGHVKAGAELLAEALATAAPLPADANAPDLVQVRALLPGLGEPVAQRVDAHSRAAGRTLGELRLRGATGASVLAIVRGERVVLMPGAGERLEVGDLLALSGTAAALGTAREWLRAAPSK
jgi:CPA2 family monovalent cation:H+ antiporter-2